MMADLPVRKRIEYLESLSAPRMVPGFSRARLLRGSKSPSRFEGRKTGLSGPATKGSKACARPVCMKGRTGEARNNTLNHSLQEDLP